MTTSSVVSLSSFCVSSCACFWTTPSKDAQILILYARIVKIRLERIALCLRLSGYSFQLSNVRKQEWFARPKLPEPTNRPAAESSEYSQGC